MILVKETFLKFGYYPESLSKGSHKFICTECDYCGISYQVTAQNRNNRISPISNE